MGVCVKYSYQIQDKHVKKLVKLHRDGCQGLHLPKRGVSTKVPSI